MTDPQLMRAAQRVTLACKALSEAANDLRVAQRRDSRQLEQELEVDDAATSLEVETERVCQLAEELGGLAAALGTRPAAAATATARL